jgi:hypothetical protein
VRWMTRILLVLIVLVPIGCGRSAGSRWRSFQKADGRWHQIGEPKSVGEQTARYSFSRHSTTVHSADFLATWVGKSRVVLTMTVRDGAGDQRDSATPVPPRGGDRHRGVSKTACYSFSRHSTTVHNADFLAASLGRSRVVLTMTVRDGAADQRDYATPVPETPRFERPA